MKAFENIRQTGIDISEDLKAYLEKDPTVSRKWHVFLFSAGFHGLLLYRISNLLWNGGLGLFARILHYFSRVAYSMDIHPAARIEGGVVIDHGSGVVIGSTASVGKGTLIYHGVTLGSKNVMTGKRHPDVGRNVVLGAGARFLVLYMYAIMQEWGQIASCSNTCLTALLQRVSPQEFMHQQ
nr:serine acetyltransferase [Mesotoga sp. HF07.pep.5.2.highcov]